MSTEQSQTPAVTLAAPEGERKRHHQRRSTRRLSNTQATRADLFEGLTVIGPAASASRRSSAHETAQAMELARHHLAQSANELPTPEDSAPSTPEEGALKTTDKYAYAFDIDGVLIKGGHVIPEAIETMKVLNGENEYGIKV
jgi:hypothetical protein